MNFNKNYLSHEFYNISYNDFCYECTKCKILIWHSGIYEVKIDEYWILDDNLLSTGIKLNISCDEAIIKNIIE